MYVKLNHIGLVKSEKPLLSTSTGSRATGSLGFSSEEKNLSRGRVETASGTAEEED